MDLRRHPRFQTDEELKVTLLDRPQDSLVGKLQDASDFGVGITLTQELAVGLLVRVEWSDTLLLGEVIHCQRQGDEFIAGIEVDEVIDKTMLAQMRRNSEPSGSS